ncbi:unnamed protein product [Owenia fusiformis]|uniref:Uncharacterized protein n=1 Tax=Owenia fusiformis TaxID=6347 RepID=A0A8J1U9Y7_OWEFU|nr:unnamed protein product [Owenia fusiformis]
MNSNNLRIEISRTGLSDKGGIVYMKMPKSEQVNVMKALSISNAFHFLLSGAKACLFPFLTLYYRQLGLTATQVGIICAAKAFSGLISTPMWMSCVSRFNKQRFVLLFSLFFMIAANLSLLLVPAGDETNVLQCGASLNATFPPIHSGLTTLPLTTIQNGTIQLTTNTVSISKTVSTSTTPESSTGETTNRTSAFTSSSTTTTSTTSVLTSTSTLYTSNVPKTVPSNNIADIVKPITSPRPLPEKSDRTTPSPNAIFDADDKQHQKKDDTLPSLTDFFNRNPNGGLSPLLPFGNDGLDPDSYPKTDKDLTDKHVKGVPIPSSTNRNSYGKYSKNEEDGINPKYDKYGHIVSGKSGESQKNRIAEKGEQSEPRISQSSASKKYKASIVWNQLQHWEKSKLREIGITQDDIEDSDLSLKQVRELISYYEKLDTNNNLELLQNIRKNNYGNGNRKRRGIENLIDTFQAKFRSLQDKVNQSKYKAFILVLFLVILGELLSCPVNKIADGALYDFLDCADSLEKFGQYSVYSSLAVALFASMIASIVNGTSGCVFHMNSFMLHFFVFGIIAGVAFIVAFVYPIHQAKKEVVRHKQWKAFKVLFGTYHSAFYVLTVFIVGALFAGINNLLLWLVEDIGGSVLQMGLAISVAALSEIPLLFISKGLVRKLSNTAVVAIAMVALSGRFIYYSFLWNPWAILPIELLHSLSFTALWAAVNSYQGFEDHPSLSSNIHGSLHAVYTGFGYALGSLLSGLVYDHYGYRVLYDGSAIIAIVWCLVFIAVQKCCKHPESVVRYKRLSSWQNEDENSDTSAMFEDDWLEIALHDDTSKKNKRFDSPYIK